ncbi:MAG: hypothetical protein HPY64_10235 [Anaerolineae bacterium]|nr:hypothetical protein [Anaerolineae bacterium]
MSARLQRLLITLLLVYFCFIGGTFYTERSAVLRLFHQLFTTILLTCWLATLWREGRAFPVTPLDRPLLAIGIVWLLAALFALDRRVSLEYTWPILVNLLAFYLLIDLMRRGRQRWIMEALFTIGTVVIVISVIEFVAWYWGIPLLPDFVISWPQVNAGLFPPVWHRLSLAFNVSTILGNFTASLIPLTVAWATTTRQRDLRFGLWLLAIGLLVTLLLTQSRSTQIALATSTGVLILTWLLQPAVRHRAPRPLRALLNPRLLIGAAALTGAALIALVLLSTLRAPLRSGDENRLDLWRSALEMAYDRPLLGVGPHEYGLALRHYGDPDLSLAQDRLVAAHNLPLHILAEGGIAALGAALWLGVAFARVWWQAWKAASPGRRRRLEGGLAALLGFGVQSLVDTFTLNVSLLPVAVIAAYTVAGHVTRSQAVTQPMSVARHRWPIYAALIALGIAQIGYLPVHAGNLAHDRAMRALAMNDFAAALEATRTAHAADPGLNLYPLHEAYILGLMAFSDPEQYLEPAIAAHETAQQLDPSWDTGWFNLAGLYAQAGRYEDAAIAARTAATWNPVEAGYHLKLGEYLETLGRLEEARAAYFEALRRQPALASSGFWTDPARPWHQQVLQAALAHFPDQPEVGLRLAVSAGDLETATRIARTINLERASFSLLRALGEWATAVNDESVAPCPECYLLKARTVSNEYYPSDYPLLAEIAFQTDGAIEQLSMTAEQLAQTALFVAANDLVRSWYTLARIEQQRGGDPALIDSMLEHAVPLLTVRQEYAMTVYGRPAAFDMLPQTRTPRLYRVNYEPWLWLVERYRERGETERIAAIYRAILIGDPYQWEIREQLEKLTGSDTAG